MSGLLFSIAACASNHSETDNRKIYLLLALIGAIQERHDLRAGAVRVGAERRVGSTVRHVACDRPVDRVGIERIGRNVGEVRAAARGALEGAVQERYTLAARAGLVGAKRCRAQVIGDAVFNGPLHRVIVVGRGRNVGELDGLLRRRLGLGGNGRGRAAVTAGDGNLTLGRSLLMVRIALIADRKCVGRRAVLQHRGERAVAVLGDGHTLAGHLNFALCGNAIGVDGELDCAADKRSRFSGDADGGLGLDDIKGGCADDRIANLNGSGSRTDVGVGTVFDRISSFNYFAVLGDLNSRLQFSTGIGLVGNGGIDKVGEK